MYRVGTRTVIGRPNFGSSFVQGEDREFWVWIQGDTVIGKSGEVFTVYVHVAMYRSRLVNSGNTTKLYP